MKKLLGLLLLAAITATILSGCHRWHYHGHHGGHHGHHDRGHHGGGHHRH